MDEIIAACKTGDKSAQKQLFATYAKGMLLLCSRYVKDGHHAEELMMNGFYKFFSTIERFRYTGKDSVSAWLKRIMVNECLMFLRERKSIRIMAEEQAADCALDETAFASISAQEIADLYRHCCSMRLWIDDLPQENHAPYQNGGSPVDPGILDVYRVFCPAAGCRTDLYLYFDTRMVPAGKSDYR